MTFRWLGGWHVFCRIGEYFSAAFCFSSGSLRWRFRTISFLRCSRSGHQPFFFTGLVQLVCHLLTLSCLFLFLLLLSFRGAPCTTTLWLCRCILGNLKIWK